jgi:hypothetical protein
MRAAESSSQFLKNLIGVFIGHHNIVITMLCVGNCGGGFAGLNMVPGGLNSPPPLKNWGGGCEVSMMLI